MNRIARWWTLKRRGRWTRAERDAELASRHPAACQVRGCNTPYIRLNTEAMNAYFEAGIQTPVSANNERLHAILADLVSVLEGDQAVIDRVLAEP